MTAIISLSNLQLFENSESVLSISPFLYDNLPTAPSAQPAGIDVTQPTDGTLLSITRDGKTAVSLRVMLPYSYSVGASDYYHNVFPGIDFLYRGSETAFDWSSFMSALTGLSNGYKWTFVPLYSNFMSGLEDPRAFLPTPSQFGPVTFKMGETVNIPIYARCASYSTTCPWSTVPPLTGDLPSSVDPASVGLLALSELASPWPCEITVQSATLVSGVPTASGTYGPTTLSPDANGFGWLPLTTDSSVEVDGLLVSFDAGLASGESEASGHISQVYVPIRSGETVPDGVTTNPYLSRKTLTAFCLRSNLSGATKYSEPRNCFVRVYADSKNRLVGQIVNGYAPFALANSNYIERSGANVLGQFPVLDIDEATILVVYKTIAGVWVRAISTDQLQTLGAEVALFNQTGGNVSVTYDHATGSQYYAMSLRDDGLSWMTTPSPSTNPSALPQCIVLRRRDSAGNSLPFVVTPGAAISGTVWENVIFCDIPSYGNIGISVLPTGTVVLSVGNELYSSTDNGSNFYDQTGTLVNSLTNMTSGIGSATGGTQNP